MKAFTGSRRGVFRVFAAAFSALVLAGCAAGPQKALTKPGGAPARPETGTPDTEWYSQNPGAARFTISTADELAGLAQIVNGTAGGVSKDDFSGKIVRLDRDIDLSKYAGGEGWAPIGDDPGWASDNNPFSGTFDGGGHVISGLAINRPNALRQGLFGNVKGGRVENVGLDRVNIRGGVNVGGIAGGLRYNGWVANSYSTGAVSGSDAVGGVAGLVLDDSNVADCYSACTVSGTIHVGGVVGFLGINSNAANCYSTGAVRGSGSGIGGVAGYTMGKWSVTGCAALNPEVKSPGGRGGGRIMGIGGDRLSQGVFSNNAAYAGMKNHTGNTAWANRGKALIDGVDMVFADIDNDPTIGGRFARINIWATEKGKLPGLHGRAVAMPEHLRQEPNSAQSSIINSDNSSSTASKGDWVPHPYDLAYNILMNCEENGIIFTNGDNDTFPLWALQEAYGIRTDVRVVNLSLLNADWYIKQLKKFEPRVAISYTDGEIGEIQPVYNPFLEPTEYMLREAGIKLIVPGAQEHRVLRVQDRLVLNIVDANKWNKPVYFALTVSDDNFMGLAPFLRTEGIVYRLMPEKVTNDNNYGLERTIELIDSVFLLREVDKSNDVARRLQTNYLQIAFDLRRPVNKLRENGDPRHAEYLAAALRFMDRCVELMPWDWRARGIRHEFYMDNGMAGEAVAAMEEAIKNDPENSSHYKPRLNNAKKARSISPE